MKREEGMKQSYRTGENTWIRETHDCWALESQGHVFKARSFVVILCVCVCLAAWYRYGAGKRAGFNQSYSLLHKGTRDLNVYQS